MEALIEKQGDIQTKIESVDGWEIDQKLDQAMDALRCPPGDSGIAHLSGGEKRRVALCRLLLSNPDILLLDEPTNHIDIPGREQLEREIIEKGATAIIVSHDRQFARNVGTRFFEIDKSRREGRFVEVDGPEAFFERQCELS